MTNYGGIYEHSPWIAAQAWARGLRCTSLNELHTAFSDVIRGADYQHQLELLRAHPQLACAVTRNEQLTDNSISEQRGAGLDQCSAAEFEEFRHLNSTYSDKFGFPFIIAVKGLDRDQILDFFRARLENSPDEEFAEALEQVIRIGKFRLQDLEDKQEAPDDV